jgi:hypothetical protein
MTTVNITRHREYSPGRDVKVCTGAKECREHLEGIQYIS